jgi:SAM-dependent methyltransferase
MVTMLFDKKKFRDRDGFLDFISDKEFYWGEMSKNEMKVFLDESKEDYFGALIKLKEKKELLPGYILSKSRGAWLDHCYSPKHSDNFLDLGSGYGTISFSLADLFDSVWSLEGVKERIEFQLLRKKLEAKENVNVIRADFESPPFQDESFDVIACNGVLEWVGLYGEENPRKLQLVFLKKLHSLLRKKGTVYIGIENRFGMNSFLGALDHSGLPYTNLVPRNIADLAIKSFRKKENHLVTEHEWKGYRTYTYSLFGYQSLLKEAGFDEVDIYWCYPSYNYPVFSGKIGNGSSKIFVDYYRPRMKKRAYKIMYDLFSSFSSLPKLDHFFDFFFPEFLIYAYKYERPRTLGEDITEKKPYFMYKRSTNNTKYFIIEKKEIIKIREVRIQKREPDKSDMANHYGNVNHVLIPNLSKENLYIYDTEWYQGDVLEVNNAGHMKRFLEWFESFQINSKSDETKPIMDEFIELKGYVDEHLASASYKDKLVSDLETLHDHHKVKQTKAVVEHGDLFRLNVIIQKDSIRVLDWEFSVLKGNPIFDVCFFVIDSLQDNKEIRRRYMNNFSRILGESNEIIEKHKPYVFLKVMKRHDIRLGNDFNENFFLFKERLEQYYKSDN